MKKILVLGANSFAGSQFVEKALADYSSVIGVNRSPEPNDIFLPYKNSKHAHKYKFVRLDINNNFSELCRLFELEKPEVVVDLAGQGMVAESWQSPEQWYQTNIVAKVKLHNYLKDKNWLKKYIRVSTPEVYGSQEKLAKESQVYMPSTPYAVSHAAIDMSLHTFYKQYNFPVIFTRFSNFYGPGQQLYRIIPRTIIYALTGRTLDLHGGGTSVRAFIHGEDVARALLDTINLGKSGEIYHFSSSDFISIRSLVEIIYEQLNLSFADNVKVVGDRPGKDANYLMDDKKANLQLNWRAEMNLEQGIANSIKWVRDNLAEINGLNLNYIHKK